MLRWRIAILVSAAIVLSYLDRLTLPWTLSEIKKDFDFSDQVKALFDSAFLISYGLMPLLDALIGEDENNPPEAVVPQLEDDRYYRWLTWATVPLHFVALIGCAWWVGTHELSWWAVLIFAYVAGTDSGLGINTGHELGHKHTVIEQWLARLVLAVPAYGHFTVEHGRGHHRCVSTPEDHASARMGESIYDKHFNEFVQKLRHEAFIKIYDPLLAKAEEEEKKAS
jgi:alkane 1-monooxygenase